MDENDVVIAIDMLGEMDSDIELAINILGSRDLTRDEGLAALRCASMTKGWGGAIQDKLAVIISRAIGVPKYIVARAINDPDIIKDIENAD